MIDIKIPMIPNVNDTYTWLYNTALWAANNCSSFQCQEPLENSRSLEPYIVRNPGNLHYTFTFEDPRDAMMFAIKWL